VRRLDDPDVVREEYADERGLAARMAVQSSATGPDPYDVAFSAVAERRPEHVLEVGCGRGELAERMTNELAGRVVALDQSERMVELTAARGVESIVGDVQDLPFADGSFDCVVAAWMLYHAGDLDLAIREVRRVLRDDGRFVAGTSSERNFAELWELVGQIGAQSGDFSAENGEAALRRHFAAVERRDVRGTVTFPDYETARDFIAASPTRPELAARLPCFNEPLMCSRDVVVFVCTP
jgi:SAM-dependent methyltransferase